MFKKIVRHINATFLGFIEILPFGVPLLIVISVHAFIKGDHQEFWFTPDWWIAIVFMMFETLRDGMRTLKPKYKGLDGISFASMMGSGLVLATIFLVYSIMHNEHPATYPFQDWLDPLQRGFVFFAVTSLWFVKYLTKNAELIELEKQNVE